MGYKHLSKQYRAVRECIDSLLVKSNNEDNPDVPIITPNPRIANKRIGVDLSVILHVALGNIISAGEFQHRRISSCSLVCAAAGLMWCFLGTHFISYALPTTLDYLRPLWCWPRQASS